MSERQTAVYVGLVRLHATARGEGNLFSPDRISDETGIHRRSVHNDLQTLIGRGKVRCFRGDGKTFYGIRGY